MAKRPNVLLILNDDLAGYPGDLSRNAVSLAEVLRSAGYGTAMSGKWHVTGQYDDDHNWPCQRGFDEYYGMLDGAGSSALPVRGVHRPSLATARTGGGYRKISRSVRGGLGPIAARPPAATYAGPIRMVLYNSYK